MTVLCYLFFYIQCCANFFKASNLLKLNKAKINDCNKYADYNNDSMYNEYVIDNNNGVQVHLG